MAVNGHRRGSETESIGLYGVIEGFPAGIFINDDNNKRLEHWEMMPGDLHGRSSSSSSSSSNSIRNQRQTVNLSVNGNKHTHIDVVIEPVHKSLGKNEKKKDPEEDGDGETGRETDKRVSGY